MQTILVTGTSGYIASRLIPRLLQAGYRVRCMTRRPERLRQRLWFAQVEMVAGDVARPETLPCALQGVHTAYYLIHSMAAGRGYHHLDLEAARNFGQAAKNAGVEHIIYLGGLVDERQELALHLKSRIESGAALREAGAPVTEFRAGVIVGPGSASFEMIRFLTELFPLILGPTWLRHKSQPIATQNVLDYLVAALTNPACHGKIIEIGGQDVMTYAESMTRFAELRGLKRPVLLLPFIPVWLMAFFIGKLTPTHHAYALPLVEGLKNDSLVLDRQALRLFPGIELLGYADAVRRCLADLHPDSVERVWLDRGKDTLQIKHEGMLIHYQQSSLVVAAASVFAALCRMSAKDGELRAGVSVHSYRVESLRENFLRLRTEPLRADAGQGWVEWKITPRENGCVLEQTAFFAPKGLPGFLYAGWFHLCQRAIFKRLVKALNRQTTDPV